MDFNRALTDTEFCVPRFKVSALKKDEASPKWVDEPNEEDSGLASFGPSSLDSQTPMLPSTPASSSTSRSWLKKVTKRFKNKKVATPAS